jgi:hypothetical protein
VLSVPVLTADPLVGSLPLQEPEATQVSAFAVVQLNSAALPAVIVAGSTLICTETVGGVVPELTSTLALWLFVPPVPVQVRV